MSTEVTVSDRSVIKGVILRCVDGEWTCADGTEPPEPLIVMGTSEALQCWKDSKPTDTVAKRPGEDLPDVKALNAQVPESEWELDMNGKPRAPWVHSYIAYFINPADAEAFTFINSTWGAKIAVERLAERISNMH